jgi:hypothetical protein
MSAVAWNRFVIGRAFGFYLAREIPGHLLQFSLRYLCGSAVKIGHTFSTTETQRTQRLRRDLLRPCCLLRLNKRCLAQSRSVWNDSEKAREALPSALSSILD